MIDAKKYIEEIDKKQDKLTSLSDEIWGYAETAFTEKRCRNFSRARDFWSHLMRMGWKLHLQRSMEAEPQESES